MKMNKENLTTKDVAESLGITRIRVIQLCQRGTMPCEKVGRDWIINRKDLESFVPRKAGRPKKQG